MSSFWHNLKKPILILAPMEEVTDSVFRRIVSRCARPDVFFTEFTNCEGILSAGSAIVAQRLIFTQEERPIVAQIWGKNPDSFYRVAKKLAAMGFDGIDINMGCPEKKIIKSGTCGALINNQSLAKSIIQATKDGAGGLPVSVKTRIGLQTIETDTWIPFLLSLGIDALTIHARTVGEMSDVPAHWDEIGKAVQIRNQMKVKTLIIGNGDVKSRAEACTKCQQYGLDGIMIGRGVFENLWVFSKEPSTSHTYEEMMKIMEEHVTLWDTTWGKTKNFSTLKKFFKIYISGFNHASDLRAQVMNTSTCSEVKEILGTYKKTTLFR